MKYPLLTFRTPACAWLLVLNLGVTPESAGQNNSTVHSRLTANNSDAFPKNQDYILFVVDESPEFPGGHATMMNYIVDHCNFPPETTDNPLSGKIVMQFVVEKDGSLQDVKVVSGIGEAYNRECKRVFEAMPNWKPGKDKGRLVRTLMVVPIKFSNNI